MKHNSTAGTNRYKDILLRCDKMREEGGYRAAPTSKGLIRLQKGCESGGRGQS